MRLTPLKAIRKRCLDCVGNSREVKLCPSKECPLWIYRFGKNPARKGIGNILNIDEEKPQKVSNHLKGGKCQKWCVEWDENGKSGYILRGLTKVN